MKILVLGLGNIVNRTAIVSALSNSSPAVVVSDIAHDETDLNDRCDLYSVLASPSHSEAIDLEVNNSIPHWTEPRKSKGDKRRDRAERRRKGWL